MRHHTHILHELPDYVSGRLDEESRHGLEEHLKTCSQCRGELEELRLPIEATDLARVPEPPEDYWASILERVRSRVEKASEVPKELGGARAIPWIDRILTSIESRVMPLMSKLAVTAAFLLGVILVVHFLWMRQDGGSVQVLNGDLRTFVEALEGEELVRLVEPAVVPRPLIVQIPVSDEDQLLGELLAEDLSKYKEPLDVLGVSTKLEGLSDQEIETVLEKLMVKVE